MLSGDEIMSQVPIPGRSQSTEDMTLHDVSINIDPFNESQINPNSYNLRLGGTLGVYPENLRYLSMYIGADVEYEMLKRHLLQKFSAEEWSNYPVIMDTATQPKLLTFDIPPEGIVLWPGVLYLGHTMERTHCNNLVPVLEGRSSVARVGVTVHETAGFGDNGFDGQWTLEIRSTFPVRVYAGSQIAQVSFEQVQGVPLPKYSGKYQGQTGPKPSGWWKELAEHKSP